jgi:hypothetical protein
MNSARVYPLLDGIDAIRDHYRSLSQMDGLFEKMYECIRKNWLRHREPDRWPTPSTNWRLRVTREFTQDVGQHFEKQLQKQIASCLENEEWGNDVCTASGLLDKHGRHMNVDLGHRISDGFELIELKIASNTPYEAALQVLRYGAIYMLYRLEPDLARRFKSNSMMCAKRIVLEVLAPHPYYSCADVDLSRLEAQLNVEVETFAKRRAVGVTMSFRFMALYPGFSYSPGMDCELIRNAVRRRASPFSQRTQKNVQVTSFLGNTIQSFSDWERYALPPDRRDLHWKEGRSAFELGRSWTSSGVPSVPRELTQLLESHEETRRLEILSAITEYETPLPFSSYGPRCHDLALRAEQDGCAVTVCIEAKSDELFGGTVADEFRKAKKRPGSMFPQRLDWLTRTLLGIPAFDDEQFLVVSDAVSTLRYQLLSAIGGTLLEARSQLAAKAVFVVHEFRTTATVDAKLDANANDLTRFVRLLQSSKKERGQDSEPEIGRVGPISMTVLPLPGEISVLYHIPLFIGKIRTDLLGGGRS